MDKAKQTFFVHECYNGNKRLCDATYKVSRHDYVCFDEFWYYDCFDECSFTNRDGITENHLYLDAGDTDYPNEITELVYDYS